ncbi:MAG: hypothetical protein C4522_08500 [Desulfobacteraceae bacterium]|nr:MAG: hypothetical protein C4522_08500 [Desulfobacteraceae bacterium]
MKKTTYAILVNPASGKTGIDGKRIRLNAAASILKANIHGLDTGSAEDFNQCALELAPHCDVLVVAGGDGTFSSVINTLDTDIKTLAYLPLGSGNALQYALGYRGNLADIAVRIQTGPVREYDLIHCDQKKRAFMVSLGIEGTILRFRDRFLRQGHAGFHPYLKAVFLSLYKAYTPFRAQALLDGKRVVIQNLLSFMVMKQPYYGYGMKVVPKAGFDDRLLHVLCCEFRYTQMVIAGLTSFSIGNRAGQYRTCKSLSVTLNRQMSVQIDGDIAWKAETFHFKVLPGALQIKC